MSSQVKSAGGGSQQLSDTSLEPPSSNEVFSILSNRRRRYAIHYLLQKDDPVDVRDLSEQVAAWEYRETKDAITYDQRRSVATTLRQCHLPKLDDANLVEYDHSRGTVEYTGSIDSLDIYMDVVARGKTISWSEFYLGLASIFVVLTLLRWASVPPFELVPPIVWGMAVSAVFLLTAVAHLQYNRTRKLGASGPPPEVKEGDRL